MSRSKIIVMVVSIAVLAIVWGTVSKKNTSNKSTHIGRVIRQDLVQRVTIAGTVTPFRKTTIAAPFEGYVKKIFVKMGDAIKPGDPIVTVVQTLQASEPQFPLRSPFSGQVVQIEKAEGQYVKHGDPKEFIVRIDDFSHLYVQARVPEIDVLKLKVGQDAAIKASAILSKKYRGRVEDIAQAARESDDWQRSNVEFTVRIEVLDPDRDVRPGMSAVLDIISARRENVLTLRHEFLYKDTEGLFVITKKGEKKRIKSGLQNEEMIEVLEGLSDKEEVEQVDFSKLVEWAS